LKKNNITARAVPSSSKIPIANPTFPAALIPPELVDVEDVELAADAMLERVDPGEVGAELLVATAIAKVDATEAVGTIEAGRPVDEEG
jgi:hypothetical protein